MGNPGASMLSSLLLIEKFKQFANFQITKIVFTVLSRFQA